MVDFIPCVGCGALVPDINGPTHRYIDASPGCWLAYTEMLANGYGSSDSSTYGAVNRLAVDTYMVQHPGVPGKQSSQSVAAHLFILCLLLERNVDPAYATPAITYFVEKHKARGHQWLEPPPSLCVLTVLDVLAATDAADHHRRARLWAESVWQAWEPHHAKVRAWADEWERDARR